MSNIHRNSRIQSYINFLNTYFPKILENSVLFSNSDSNATKIKLISGEILTLIK